MSRATLMPPGRHHTLTSSRFIAFLLHFTLLFELAGQATCHPTRVPRVPHNGLDRPPNQAEFSSSETVQTENHITLMGLVVIERCKLSFTPISTNDGPTVQVVKSCSFEPVNDTSSDSAGSCGPASTTTVMITSTSTGVAPPSTVTSAVSITTSASTLSGFPSNVTSSVSKNTVSATTVDSSGTVVSQPTIIPVTASPSITSSASASITLSLTSVLPPSTTTFSQQTSTPSTIISATLTDVPSSTSSPFSQSELSSTTPSTATLPALTSPANNVASVPPVQSSVLPKVIGAFAGVAVLLLIVGATIGYLKMKKLHKKDLEEPIRWPVT